jgi:hypothetical protein
VTSQLLALNSSVDRVITHTLGVCLEMSSSNDSVSIPTAHQHELGSFSPAMQYMLTNMSTR